MEDTKKVYPVCRRCGRVLKSDEAKERGMGKVCWEKSQHDPHRNLFVQRGKNDELPKDNEM